MEKAITNTTKEPECKRSKCNSGGKTKAPELPDFSGHFGGRWIASLLRPQKAVFASLVRKIFETGGHFGKSNFSPLFLFVMLQFGANFLILLPCFWTVSFSSIQG